MELGSHPDKGSANVAGGGYILHIRGCREEYIGENIRYTGGVIDNEAVVLTCVSASAKHLPDRFGEYFGRLRSPVQVG